MKSLNKSWIDSIPSTWHLGRISYKYHVQLGKMLQPEPKSFVDVKKPYLRSANLDWNGVKLDDLKEMWFSPDDLKKYKLEVKDVLVSEGGDVGRSSYWENPSEMYIQNAINRLRPINEDSVPRFLYYWFAFLKSHGLIDIMCDSSTIAHYTAEKVKATQLVFPPKEEQTLIARFLDQKTSQIDQLIEQKEKLLKLLAEKRTAIITQAVTGKMKVLAKTSELGFSGLVDDGIIGGQSKSSSSENQMNPDADKYEMKDSGVDWLGEIPKQWKTIKLRYLGRMKSGEGITTLEMVENGEYPVYGGNGFRGYATDYTHDGDYVLIGRQGALCGNVNYAKGKFWASEHAVVVTKAKDVDLVWLGELLRIMNLNQYSISAAQPGLAIDRIQNLKVPLPPKSEQKLISDFLVGFKSKWSVDEKIKDSIVKLKEYREALITAAVTGQIDVRKEVENV